MKYKLNEQKVFSDKVDNQLVFIDMETFVYYTFNQYAAAVIEDLLAGNDSQKIVSALNNITKDGQLDAKFNTFLEELKKENILIDSDVEENPQIELKTSLLPMTTDTEFIMDKYAEVAEYFATDPIHEVAPEKGWPNHK